MVSIYNINNGIKEPPDQYHNQHFSQIDTWWVSQVERVWYVGQYHPNTMMILG